MKGGTLINPPPGGGHPVLILFGLVGAMLAVGVQLMIDMDKKDDGDGPGKSGSGGSNNDSRGSRSQVPITISNTLTIDYEGDRRRRQMAEQQAYENYQREKREQEIEKRNQIVGAIACIVFIILVYSNFYPSSIFSPVFSIVTIPFRFLWNNLLLILGIGFGVKAISFYNNNFKIEVTSEYEKIQLKYALPQEKSKIQGQITDKILSQQAPLLLYTSAALLLLLNYFWPIDSSQSVFHFLWKNVVVTLGIASAIKTYTVSYEYLVYKKEEKIKEILFFGVVTFALLYLWSGSPSHSIFESGIDYDEYFDDALAEKAGISKEQQQSLIYNTYYTQTSKAYGKSNTKYMNNDKFTSLVNGYRDERDKENKKDSKNEENLETHLLPVPMPSAFSYTGAIELNNLHQGLYHSLSRHYSQWSSHLPSLSNIPSSFRNAFDVIEGRRTRDGARDAFNQYRTLLSSFSNTNDLFEIHNAQLQMYQFIRNTVTSENYMGERININNNLQVYFKIPGTNEIMVLAVSRELVADPIFDVRPYRTIITIFFTKNDANLVTKMFDKDGFKKL